MASNDRFNIYGHNGSPYSCKIRSYFRFKRISFNWYQNAQAKWSLPKFKKIKAKVIPIIEYPNNGPVMNESTKIIQKFESQYPNRNVFISSTPTSLQFLSNFLEDFSDEWLTKLMFGFRWNRKIDQDWSSLFLILNNGSQFISNPQVLADYIKKRQVRRTDLVGCANDPLIHNCAHQILNILQNHFKNGYTFLFGNRPSNADFGIYGQIKQFTVDPTSDKIVRDKYIYVYAWITRMDDLSGVDVKSNKGWISLDDVLAGTKNGKVVTELLKVCGDIYLPFLKANSDAFMKGEKRFSVQLLVDDKYNGVRKVVNHEQPTFKWQVKCYKELKRQLSEILSVVDDRDTLITILKHANCYDLLMDNNMQSKL